MLIDHPRITAADRAVWRQREAMDRAVYTSGAVRDLEERALATLREFILAGPCYVSVSWGKDSVVVAHLLWRLLSTEQIDAPLVWFPAGEIENPDCVLVRDAFLARYPVRDYQEHLATLPHDDWNRAEGHDGAQAEFERVARSVGTRYVTGVRAEESKARELAMARYGEATDRTCRPIGRWRTEHVYAYLCGWDLPVHPAYACSYGGALPREWIRVGTIGGYRGRGRGRAEWEQRYYPEIARRIRM